jgi:DNA-binding response OmpR family regulator
MNTAKKRILVVDDDLNVLKLLQRALCSHYELLVAPTGYELEMMVDHFVPDLIIMDLSFPDENGRDLCRGLRMRRDYDSVAILVLSGLDEPAVAAAAIQGGADGFMTKPFDLRTLQSTIAHIIASKQQVAVQSVPASVEL